MPRKKPQPANGNGGKPKPPNRSPHRQYNLRIKPRLARAFDAYVESIEPETSATAVIEMLMRNHLSEKGLWPPGDEEPKSS